MVFCLQMADILSYFIFIFFCRELLLNNNLLRVLPYELGRLFRLQTLGLKGEAFILKPLEIL